MSTALWSPQAILLQAPNWLEDFSGSQGLSAAAPMGGPPEVSYWLQCRRYKAS